MNVRQTIVGVAVAVLLISGGSTAAVAGDPTFRAVAATASSITAAAPVPPAQHAEFVPISPCRYLDTRSQGGAFGNGTGRSYPRRCGIPAYARALAVSMSAVTPSGNGYLQAGLTAGRLTTVVNYTRGESITSGSQIPVNASGIRLINHGGPTQVTLDVLGYYQPPMYAYIAYDGSHPAVEAGSRVVSVTATAVGRTVVTFDRDITYCDLQATPFSAYRVFLNVRGSWNTVIVDQSLPDQSGVFNNFYVRVTC